MDNLLDRFFNNPWDLAENDVNRSAWWPSVDVMETDNEVVVRAEVAGVDPKDLDVSISGQVLTLTGEKKRSSEKKDENYYHTERFLGTFRRTIELPTAVSADHQSAEYKNGVLEIRMKKEPSLRPKRIPVAAK
jgi:HSP20 family protein